MLLIATSIIGILWALDLGWRRGVLSLICRMLWLTPLFLSFFAQKTQESKNSSLALTPFFVLIDDSQSMQRSGSFAESEKYLKGLQKRCNELACDLRISRLSELSTLTGEGYTPLSAVLPDWLASVGMNPWILFSDGEDFEPERDWSEILAEQPKFTPARGIIVGKSEPDQVNVWIKDLHLPSFSFADKRISGSIRMGRADKKGQLGVQVLVSSEDKTLTSINVDFIDGSDESSVDFELAGLSRGQHLLTFRSLPLVGEKNLWDNQTMVDVEVMPDTIGVLHLLGAPSWDGRFLRRFIKAEPKFDLVSFFILRDPWDQAVDERQLSLIPFPVNRLFMEELPKFRLLILQNFNLLQFLQPEYQHALVEFVKNGGGLLFIGGPRSLMATDLKDSPLKDVLPFSNPGARFASTTPDPFFALEQGEKTTDGPYYEEELSYKVAMADATLSERELASVYDDWQQNQDLLQGLTSLSGLHHMEKVVFKEGSYTPLLNAITSSGQKIPLAVASYPGKGRALWLFSDSFWRSALSDHADIARDFYHDFFASAFTWLLRQDLRKQLIASNLHIRKTSEDRLSWSAALEGPTLAYFALDSRWQLTLCGKVLTPGEIDMERRGNQSVLLKGNLGLNSGSLPSCTLHISGQNAAFGSVNAQTSALLSQSYPDQAMGFSKQKLEDLSRHAGATLLLDDETTESKISAFLNQFEINKGIREKLSTREVEDHFWWMKNYWIWLLLLFLPVEVVLRRLYV